MEHKRELKFIYAGIALMLAFALGACDSDGKDGTEASSEKKLTAKAENTSDESESKSEEADSSSDEDTERNLPIYLPSDFPLPDDAKITMKRSEENDGKKYAFLTIRTAESMDAVTSMYTAYFDERKLEDAVWTIDTKNIIIQGDSPAYSEYWSMIGGLLSDPDGIIELIITWEEL